MNSVVWVLVGWSAAAMIWWLIAIWLVWKERSSAPRSDREPESTLTVFKSLPGGASSSERAALAGALQTFIAQLGPRDELLLGVPQDEAAFWQPQLASLEDHFPKERLRILRLPVPRQRANPKIAWLEQLASHARGELWLWSDADIVAPPGLLLALKAALAGADGGAVTCPYCVRQVGGAAAVLDAAFVNAEFLPGALLLGRLGTVDFAFGAATIFRAADFHARVTWEQLGAALADDYALGQQLKPVRLSGPMVETLALETTAAGALRHYYRWQKTIRWCRPGSYAALLAITPWLGWMTLACLRPADGLAWTGLAAQWAVEVLALVALCAALRCRVGPGAWPALALWPPLRAMTWLAVWLPLPVQWRGPMQQWSRPAA
jgi:hypothetical protein